MLQELILIDEIMLQSKIARRALEHLKQLDEENLDRIEVWSTIQSFLVSSGNVSKILWPRKQYKSRGDKLRSQLKVSDDNPLAKRSFRNHFEHYDERVEEWFAKHPTAIYDDLAMNPSLLAFDVPSAHRGYNSFNNTLLFRGELLDLNELQNAIDELIKICQRYTLI